MTSEANRIHGAAGLDAALVVGEGLNSPERSLATAEPRRYAFPRIGTPTRLRGDERRRGGDGRARLDDSLLGRARVVDGGGLPP